MSQSNRATGPPQVSININRTSAMTAEENALLVRVTALLQQPGGLDIVTQALDHAEEQADRDYTLQGIEISAQIATLKDEVDKLKATFDEAKRTLKEKEEEAKRALKEKEAALTEGLARLNEHEKKTQKKLSKKPNPSNHK